MSDPLSAVLEGPQSPAISRASAVAPSNLRVEFAWTAAANVIYAGCQWGMLALLAKNCAVSEVGRFALGLAITAPIILASQLQLRAVQATDALGRNSFREYVQLRFGMTTAALVVIVAVCARQTGFSSTGFVVLMLGASKAFESISDVLHGYLQQQERMQLIARSMIIKGILGAGAVAIASRMWHRALPAAAGIATISALVLMLYDCPVTARLRRQNGKARLTGPIRLGRLGNLAILAAPLGIVQGLVSLSANIPRYELQQTAGLAALGIYSALASLIVVGQTVVNALGNVVSPRLALYYAQRRTAVFQSVILKSIAVGVALGLVGTVTTALFGSWVLKLIFRPEYAAHADALVIIMIGATLAYVAWFAGFAMTAAGLFKEQIPLLLAVCGTVWAVGKYTIPLKSLSGAAIAFTLSMGVQAAGACAILWVALKRRSKQQEVRG